jgi:hypothetical protein
MIRSNLSAKPLQMTAKALPKKIQELADKQVVADIMQSAMPSNPAIVTINPGKVANIKPIAPSFTVTIDNTTEDAVTGYAFNTDTYKTNVGGATVTYSDGFDGKFINKLAADSEGLLFYGFNVTGYDAEGVKSDAVVNALAMELRSYNGYGDSYVPTPFSIAGSERNTQYKDGLFTVKTKFVLNCVEQIKVALAAGCSVQFVFFTQPMQD